MFNKPPPDGALCPRLKAPCVERKCRFWVRMRGVDSNTGQQVDEENCVDVWRVLLQVEGNKETRQAAAAIESFRNEVVRDNERFLAHANVTRLPRPS